MQFTLNGLFKFNDEKMTIDAPCNYLYNKDLITISYNESSEDGSESTFTTIEIDSNQKIVISRKNNLTTKIIIELDKKNSCMYETPFGIIPLETIGHLIENDLYSNGGSLKLEYKIYSRDLEASSNSINLKICNKLAMPYIY